MNASAKHVVRFFVAGVHDADKASQVKAALANASQVSDLHIDPNSQMVEVSLFALGLNVQTILDALKNIGLTGEPQLQMEAWGAAPRIVTVNIEEMDCPVEANEIEQALSKVSAVKAMHFHPERREAQFEIAGSSFTNTDLLAKLESLSLPGKILQVSSPAATGTLTASIPELDCHAEARDIAHALADNAQVAAMHFDMELHEARFELTGGTPQSILDAIAAAGYQAAQKAWEAVAAAAGAERTLRVRVEEMDCPVEAGEIQEAFKKSGLVESVQCDTVNRVATFTLKEAGADPAPILATLQAIGLPGEVLAARKHAEIVLKVANMKDEKDAEAVLAIIGLDARLNKEDQTVAFATDTEHLFDITSRLEKAGWTAEVQKQAAAKSKQNIPWLRLGTALAFAAIAEALEITGALPNAVKIGFAVAAIILAGFKTYQKGFSSLARLNFNMSTLMTVAVAGAVCLGAWPEAAMVIALYETGEAIEQLSMARARNAIASLLSITPPTATVRVNEAWQSMPVEAVPAGAIYRIEPGERAALDGVVVAGAGAMDESMITGESMPVEKKVGSSVWAGALAKESTLEIRATAASSESMSSRIIRAVEGAEQKKAKSQRFIDRFASYYTPAIFIFALAVAAIGSLVTGEYETWIYRGLVMLVIGCPCSLVISTPATIVSALALAARNGVLVKGGVYLEQGRNLTNVALDKTGTITRGEPVYQSVTLMPGAKEGHTWEAALALAAMSSHPVSRAIATAAKAKNIAQKPVTDFKALPGYGTEGRVDGNLVRLTNLSWLEKNKLATPAVRDAFAALQQQGRTGVAVSDFLGVMGVFAVADEMKPQAAQAIAKMKQAGLQPWLLTGDNHLAASAIGKAAGIDNVRAELLPEQKLSIIEELEKKGVTAMVGDGINDAPSLARADIGFAMGIKGADSAIEAADVTLMDDDIGKIAWFKNLSQLTYTTLLTNIAFALLVKFGFAIVDLMGYATMWMAVFADTGVLLIVMAWGMRLLRAGKTVDRMTALR